MAKKIDVEKTEIDKVELAPGVDELVKEKSVVNPKKDGWNTSRLFWGLLLIVIGALILTNNFGWTNVHWSNLWRLWPLIIVAAGLSVLSLRSRVWRLITAVFVILTLGAVVLVSLVDYKDLADSKTYNITSQKISDEVKLADITIKAGASRINIDTADQDIVVKARLDSSFIGLNQSSVLSGSNQLVTLSMEGGRHWWRGSNNSLLDVTLTDRLPLKLALEIGASDTYVDLSNGKVQSVDVNAGASAFVLKLGDQLDNTAVDISSGVSSIVLQVPASSGISVRIDGGLSSKHMADLIKSGNTYESSNYAVATKKVAVVGSIGLASLTIERY